MRKNYTYNYARFQMRVDSRGKGAPVLAVITMALQEDISSKPPVPPKWKRPQWKPPTSLVSTLMKPGALSFGTFTTSPVNCRLPLPNILKEPVLRPPMTGSLVSFHFLLEPADQSVMSLDTELCATSEARRTKGAI